MEIKLHVIENLELLQNIETVSEKSLSDCHFYNPIYEKINKDSNVSNEQLNNCQFDSNHKITKILSQESYNTYLCSTNNNNNSKNIFFKYCPLVDPVKILLGKYENENIMKLPKYNDNSNIEKMNRIYNSSYLDGFFSYLSSKLINKCNFLHSIEYFGGFLANKTNFKLDIIDEIEILLESILVIFVVVLISFTG